jgi:hypothetical protein
MRHTTYRMTPRFDPRWLLVLLAVGAVVAAFAFVRLGSPEPRLELLALGPDGEFEAELVLPADWGDSSTVTAEAPARFPLILAVRNDGFRAALPERLSLSLPVRFRLVGPGGEPLPGRIEVGTPLITYTIQTRTGPVAPGRVPVMIPGFETLWLEVVIPRYHCVTLGEGIPEFVPAEPPPLGVVSRFRVFYSFAGDDLEERQTGTLDIQVDTTLLVVQPPPTPPTFPVESDSALAHPELGPLVHVGSRLSECGEPDAPMELLSTVWETEGGARLITLDYRGVVRKHLYDLNGDGIVDRESWDPEGDGRMTATRRAQLPVPEFLLPVQPDLGFDLAAFDGLPPDSLERLDPLRGAMAGPGSVPGVRAAPRRPGDELEPEPAPLTPAPAAPPGTPQPDPPAQPPAPPAQPAQPAQPPAQPVQPVQPPAQPPAQPVQPPAQPVQPPARPAEPLGQPVQPPGDPEQG